MINKDKKSAMKISRRDFLSNSGKAAICGAIGAGFLSDKVQADTSDHENANKNRQEVEPEIDNHDIIDNMGKWPYPVKYGEETEVEADVLVLGGGVAGCHAAINAAKRGAKVILVDKGPVERSGCSGAGVDHWHLACTNPCSNVSPEDILKELDKGTKGGAMGYGEYGNGISCYIQCRESYDALLDVEKMGVPVRDEKDEFIGAEFRDDKSKLLFCYDYENKHCIRVMGANVKPALYKEALRQGVEIYDRVMGTGLLNENGKTGKRVIGATGLNVRTGEFYIFKAKATILAMSSPNGLWVFSTELNGSASSFWDPNNTGDGSAMAWEAGAELLQMDSVNRGLSSAGGFMYPSYGVGNAHNTWFACTIVDADGKEVPWVDKDGNELKTISQRYRPVKGQKLILGIPFAPKNVQTPSLIPDLPERIEKGEFKLPFYADLPSMPEHERRVIFGLHVGNEGKTQVPVYGNYTQAGFNPDKDMLQVSVMPPDNYNFKPWWMGMAVRHWQTLGGAGLAFDWDLKSTLPGLYGAGMQLAFSGDHSSAATTGRYSGRKAAEYAKRATYAVVSRKQVDQIKKKIYAPVNRSSGTGWKELKAGICRIMQDYCGEFRTKEVLEKGLKWLDSINESEAANACARNPHELMRIVECQTQITLGKLVMHACIAAKKADNLSKNKIKQGIMKMVMRDKGKNKQFQGIMTRILRGHYITVRQENGRVKTGKLPHSYWLKPPYASSYKENYEKHCSL